MAVFSKQSLIAELLDRVELIKAGTLPFLRLTDEQLNYRPHPDKWSIAEIFEHLNIIHAAYIRSIISRITSAPDVRTDTFKSGWLGDWLYSAIMPRPDGSVFKMKTLKSLYPGNGNLEGHEVLHRFLQQCDGLDDILRHVSTKNLQKIRIPFASNRFLRLRLGDNLRYLVAHSERHLLQAQRLMNTLR
jgi:DinB family protein